MDELADVWLAPPGGEGGIELADIDPRRLAVRAATARVIDGRGTLNADAWRDAGWTARALGRP
ncbi:hypothetical protein [Streptomyces europaeiscabiei]|uniref:hypothetical protein n=1 Tax=Streptomyces europaeiscabiei TaxID=146819 RepID=UPI0038F76B2A